MDDKSPRHWHGNFGDRYEHHNVWVRGGPPQIAPGRRPSAPTEAERAAADRRASTTSNMSSSSSSNANAGTPTTPSVGERRRSSANSNSLFSNLNTQKRDSTDPNAAQRRASYNDQMQRGGFFSKWWDGYTKGNK